MKQGTYDLLSKALSALWEGLGRISDSSIWLWWGFDRAKDHEMQIGGWTVGWTKGVVFPSNVKPI